MSDMSMSDIKYLLAKTEENYYCGVAEDYIALGLYETCLLRLSKQVAKDIDYYGRYTKLIRIADRLQKEVYK